MPYQPIYHQRPAKPNEIIKPELILPGHYSIELGRKVAELMDIECCTSHYRSEIADFKCGEMCPTIGFDAPLEGKNVLIMGAEPSGLLPGLVVRSETQLLGNMAKNYDATHVMGGLFNIYGARQDKRSRILQQPLTIAKDLDALKRSYGYDSLLTVDAHSEALTDYFDPAYAVNPWSIYLDSLKEIIDGNNEEFVILAPDDGAAKRLGDYSSELGIPMAVGDKKHDEVTGETKANYSKKALKILHGKRVIFIDDMIDTAGTLTREAEELQEIASVRDFTVVATYPLLSGSANEKLQRPIFSNIIVPDLILKEEDRIMLGDKRDNLQGKLTVVPIAPFLAKIFSGQFAVGDVMTRGELI